MAIYTAVFAFSYICFTPWLPGFQPILQLCSLTPFGEFFPVGMPKTWSRLKLERDYKNGMFAVKREYACQCKHTFT